MFVYASSSNAAFSDDNPGAEALAAESHPTVPVGSLPPQFLLASTRAIPFVPPFVF
jgi:hypothetical protein